MSIQEGRPSMRSYGEPETRPSHREFRMADATENAKVVVVRRRWFRDGQATGRLVSNVGYTTIESMVLVMGMGEGLLGRHSFHRQKEGKARLEEQIHGFGRRIPTRMEVRRRLDGPFIGQRGHIQSQDAEGGEERHDVGIGSTGRGWSSRRQRTWIGGRNKNLHVQPRRPERLLFRRSGNRQAKTHQLSNSFMMVHGVDVPRDPLPGAGEREGAIGYSGFALASEKLDDQRDLLAFDAAATAALDYEYGLRLFLGSLMGKAYRRFSISQRKLYADELERRSEELEWLNPSESQHHSSFRLWASLGASARTLSLRCTADEPDAASSLLIPDRVSRSPSDNVELGLCVSEQHGIGEPGRETSGQTKKTIHGGR
ncbi:hypothetical protein C8R47DRAFT_1069239 [Mycena vitilis]|nr:hypothetical protein C8R47DRAFT_1069239 [Mycena vitilis]